MDINILSSPAKAHTKGQEWDTPTRAKVRALRAAGKSYKEIKDAIGGRLQRSTIQRIIKAPSSKRSRKGKQYKPKKLTLRDIRQIRRYVEASWDHRCASWARIKADLNLNTFTTCIRRTLKTLGYHRCIACPRPFINRKQALKRLYFCKKHRWWGTDEWSEVIWSDEATFETGKRGRIWVTRRPDQKACSTCIKSIYRSGRVNMIV